MKGGEKHFSSVPPSIFLKIHTTLRSACTQSYDGQEYGKHQANKKLMSGMYIMTTHPSWERFQVRRERKD